MHREVKLIEDPDPRPTEGYNPDRSVRAKIADARKQFKHLPCGLGIYSESDMLHMNQAYSSPPRLGQVINKRGAATVAVDQFGGSFGGPHLPEGAHDLRVLSG